MQRSERKRLLINSRRKRVRLWGRDQRILEDLKHGFYSLSQIARLHFTTRKKAAERMKLLADGNFVKRFPNPLFPEKHGKAEFIYYDKNRRLPRGYRWLSHSLCTTEFKVHLFTWLRSTPDLAGVFFHASQIPRLLDGNLRPDGAFTLEKDEKKLLYFLEVDSGSESLRSSSGYEVTEKLDLYGDYFDTAEYQRDFRWLGEFRGFRVTILFTSEERLRHFQVITQARDADFVLLSTMELLEEQGFSGGVWTAHDGTIVNLFGKKERGGLDRGNDRDSSPHLHHHNS